MTRILTAEQVATMGAKNRAAHKKIDLRPHFREMMVRDYGEKAGKAFDRAQNGDVAKPAAETRQQAGNGLPERSGTCLTLELPYPPSKNALDVRRVATSKVGKRYSARSDSGVYRDYKRAVWLEVRSRQRDIPVAGDLAIDVTVYPPDRRRRDLLNPLEALCDALTHAGVWLDDSQIVRAVVRRGIVCEGGKCVITITEA